MHALIHRMAAPGQTRRRILPLALLLAALVSLAHTQSLRADIFRWDNQALIPGTQGITPGPGVQLDHRDLAFANLPDLNLTGANFDSSDLTQARIARSTLTNANLSFAKLTGASLNSTNLSNARLESTTLTSVDFSGAQITGANFATTTPRGFTAEQLYSTASYQEKNLTSVRLADNNLAGWDFRGQDLRGVSFQRSTLTGADLTGSEIAAYNAFTFLESITSRGFTKEQLYSTASYQRKDLSFVSLFNNDLSGWDFSGFNLTRTSFGMCNLLNTNFTGAVVDRGSFPRTTARGFSAEQLYSTAN